MLSTQLRSMVEDRVGLARAIAHQEWKKLTGYDRDDVLSWAYHGLISAAERWPAYCEENNFEPYIGDAQSWFDTYATRRIRGAIIDQLRAGDVATRRERKTIKEIMAKEPDLLPTSWDRESPEKIARRTGLPVAEVASALKAMKRAPLPLDEMLASSGGAAFVAPVSVEDAAGELDLCSVFVAAVAGLQPLYRIVLVLAVYKGYDDEKIVAEVPELSGDHMISSHALSWVAHLREQAICEVLGVLRTHLGAAEVELPRRARPAPRGRRASTPSSEPEGAVSLAMLAAG